MSRVLARSMFKKNAPKRSAKGVGITAMLEDDVPGYAEGGEVIDDRTERERLARQLLEQNRDQGEMYQRFSEQERPRQYRPPATMPMPPQPNPQQVQAAQMQQMAQMGMIPRFQEGGFVEGPVQPQVETPSAWSRITERLALPFRERTGPILDPNTGEPVEFYNPEDPLDRAGFAAAQLAASRLTGGIARLPRPGAGGMGRPGPWEMDRTTGPWSRPTLPGPRAQPPEPKPPGPTGPSIPAETAPGTSVPRAGSRPDQLRFPRDIRDKVATALPEPIDIPEPTYRDEGSPAGDYGGEGGGVMGGAMKAAPKTESKRGDRLPAAPPPPPKPPSGRKDTDLEAIKASREENKWLALMQAGLAIAGGRSPNAITNIGQGGQAGLASFMALEQQRRRDEDAAMRRSIAQREVDLQEQRLNMMAPYYQAQTAYLQARPAIEAQRLQGMQQAALSRARREAGRAWETESKNNQKYVGMDPTLLAIERDIFIRKEEGRLAPEYLQQFMYGGQNQGSSFTPPEE